MVRVGRQAGRHTGGPEMGYLRCEHLSPGSLKGDRADIVRRLLFAAVRFAVLVALAAGCGKGGLPGVEDSSLPLPDLSDRLPLSLGWSLRTSDGLGADGAAISAPGFALEEGVPASVPSTVLGVLVENGVYPDPTFGMNLRAIPGTTYPIGANFSNLPMPLDSPFRVSWWYRIEFALPAAFQGRSVYLHFEGINYRAEIWLNGRRIADRQTAAGAYRHFAFDVTDAVVPGGRNCLAVEVFPPGVRDLAITWVDWNPLPADKNMGLWREVYLTAAGDVTLRHPQVVSDLDLPSLETARLSVFAELHNRRQESVTGELVGRIEDLEFSQTVELGPGESRTVAFTPDRHPVLDLTRPRLWWPTEVGSQHLYELDLRFLLAGEISDRQSVRFGIREISSEINEHGSRVFQVNGRNILIKGGGWAQDLLLRPSPERERQEILYVKDLHLNTIRLEGQIVTRGLLDLCDELGIMVIAGWCCCAHWERWSSWDEEDRQVARESQRSQLVFLRNHPSVIDWLNGSDFHPPPDVERAYLEVIESVRWPNPCQSSATEEPSPVTGPTGLKMTGPYEYVPPVYWYEDTRNGGAFGFNTETSPGPAVPPLESLRAMLPEEHLWPIDPVWNYHAGGGVFGDLRVFTRALNERYGVASGVEDYARKAQALTYEAQRAMFEAYSRNKYRATGVIQWMLNDAWPSLIWHLYDYYLRPAGGYFGTKKACEPLHVQYSYDDRSVVVVNARYEAFPKMRVTARVFNLDSSEKFAGSEVLDVPADSSTRIFTLPEIQGLSQTYFLRLTLEDADGGEVSSNFYWLSTREDVLLWFLTQWHYTPTLIHADFRALQHLPPAALEVSAHAGPAAATPRGRESRFSDSLLSGNTGGHMGARASLSEESALSGKAEVVSAGREPLFEVPTLSGRPGEEGSVTVELRNAGQGLAFLVHLKLLRQDSGQEVLPILWEDNYFSLLPGEQKRITARFRAADLGGAASVVEIEGWNVPAVRLAAGAASVR